MKILKIITHLPRIEFCDKNPNISDQGLARIMGNSCLIKKNSFKNFSISYITNQFFEYLLKFIT